MSLSVHMVRLLLLVWWMEDDSGLWRMWRSIGDLVDDPEYKSRYNTVFPILVKESVNDE